MNELINKINDFVNDKFPPILVIYRKKKPLIYIQN
jgi:hypothetical protein